MELKKMLVAEIFFLSVWYPWERLWWRGVGVGA
jgi:hypothetical protein